MNNTSRLSKNSKLNALAIAVLLIGFTASVWAQGSPGAPGGQPMGKGPAGGPPGGPPNVPAGSPGSPGGPPVGAKAPAVPSGAPAGQVAGGKQPGGPAGLTVAPGAPQKVGGKLAGGPTGAPPSRNPNALQAQSSKSAGSNLRKGNGVLGSESEK